MKADKMRFLFILTLLVCGTVVQAQTSESNREKVYQKFKNEIERSKKHKEEMLLKAKASSNSGNNQVSVNSPSTLPAPQSGNNATTTPELKISSIQKTVKPVTNSRQR